MSELIVDMILDESIKQSKESGIKKDRLLTFKMRLRCRCCDKVIPDRIITCGFCAVPVDQNECKTPYGKWFHNMCFNDFRNFYSSLFTINAIKDRTDLIQFRDYILFQMIMRKDLRSLKHVWHLLVKNKAVPLVLSQQYVGNGMRK